MIVKVSKGVHNNKLWVRWFFSTTSFDKCFSSEIIEKISYKTLVLFLTNTYVWYISAFELKKLFLKRLLL